MTREEKLWSMTAKTLQEVGEKAGVKITNSDIKKGKAIIIAKIMAAEAAQIEESEELTTEEAAYVAADVEAVKELKTSIEISEQPKAEETTPKAAKAPKKANLKLSELTYKGKTKSIKEWAAEINMPWPTLYDRVNRNGWPIDLAIETPLGQRRPKNK